MNRKLLTMSVLAACTATLAASAQTSYQPAPAAKVTIQTGTLQGAEPAPGIRAYLGIPYAKAPVGDLRWAPPAPFDKWTGTREAVKHGAPCAQNKYGWNDAFASKSQEDCLFLNVWAPDPAENKGQKLPVMVYIHGGANVAGSASEDLSSGLAFVPHNVLLVTFNYRLGVFGFLRTPALDAASEHKGSSGNYALMDQVAALQWVKQNIAAFGGDPDNVTIFGQSAGAVNVSLLMTSPLAKGLFSKAMEESGQALGLMPTSTQEESEMAWSPVANALAGNAGAASAEGLKAMRAATVEAVLAANAQAPKPDATHPWGFRGASVDGWVLPQMPAQAWANGDEAAVPLLIGSNVQEIVDQHETEAEEHKLIEATFDDATARGLESVYAQKGSDPLLGGITERWPTDRDFRCAVRQIAEWHAYHGRPVFMYQFDRPAKDQKIAQHSSELFFVFNYFPGHWESPEDDAISKLMTSYWTAFATTGHPAVQGAPTWVRYRENGGIYLHFPVSGPKPDLKLDLGGQACHLIDKALEEKWRKTAE